MGVADCERVRDLNRGRSRVVLERRGLDVRQYRRVVDPGDRHRDGRAVRVVIAVGCLVREGVGRGLSLLEARELTVRVIVDRPVAVDADQPPRPGRVYGGDAQCVAIGVGVAGQHGNVDRRVLVGAGAVVACDRRRVRVDLDLTRDDVAQMVRGGGRYPAAAATYGRYSSR